MLYLIIMKKIKIYLYIFILLFCGISIQGCFESYLIGSIAGASYVNQKEREKREIGQALLYEKYERINKERKKAGLPLIEVPKYEEKKAVLLH
jgi:hypothetical protein